MDQPPSTASVWSSLPLPSAPIESYAQNLEDVRLWRALRDVRTGTYVDVGAHHPEIDSVTRLFYDRGWSGINIEPGPLFERLARERSRDTNLRVAVAEEERQVTLRVPQGGTGLASVHPLGDHLAEDYRSNIDTYDVDAAPLGELLSPLAGREIHFLKIDVEGAERAVLVSNDWERFRPWVVVIESVLPLSRQQTRHQWSDILAAQGYRFAHFDGLNDFYVRGDLPRDLDATLDAPVCTLDAVVTPDLRAARAEIARLRSRTVRGLLARLRSVLRRSAAPTDPTPPTSGGQ